MLIIPRRKLLLGCAAGICAPAIVRAQTLMGTNAGSSKQVVTGGGGNVAVDAVGTELYTTGGSPASYTGITVGSGTHRALILTIAVDNPGGADHVFGAVWDAAGANQTMTSIVISDVPTGIITQLFGLVAPASGNKTLTVTWTNAAFVYLSAICFTGVNQTGGSTSFPNSQSGTTAATLSVTSAASDMVVCVGSASGAITAVTGTTIYRDVVSGGVRNSFANYDNGSATVVIGQGSANDSIVATDVKAG